MAAGSDQLLTFNLSKRQVISYAYRNIAAYTSAMYVEEIECEGNSVICYASRHSDKEFSGVFFFVGRITLDF